MNSFFWALAHYYWAKAPDCVLFIFNLHAKAWSNSMCQNSHFFNLNELNCPSIYARGIWVKKENNQIKKIIK